jgi:glucose/mannose transport system permease protein
MNAKDALIYLILVIFAFGMILPIWAAVTTSLKTSYEVATTSPLSFPVRPTLEAYRIAFDSLAHPYVNSILMALGGVLGSVFLGSICGYFFSKVKFRHSDFVFFVLAIGSFIPYQSILVPLYTTIINLHMYSTVQGLILAHTAYGIPMCTILFRNFYTAVPDELIDAAKVDGAGTWRIYFDVLLPVTLLSIVIVVVFQFTSIWNEFLFGLVLGGGETQAMPATVALNNLKGSLVAQWNVQMAGAMLVALPVLLLYIFMGKYLIKGYMSGAIK